MSKLHEDSVVIPKEPTPEIIAAMEKARALAGNEYFTAIEDAAEQNEHRNDITSVDHHEYTMVAAYAALVKEVSK